MMVNSKILLTFTAVLVCSTMLSSPLVMAMNIEDSEGKGDTSFRTEKRKRSDAKQEEGKAQEAVELSAQPSSNKKIKLEKGKEKEKETEEEEETTTIKTYQVPKEPLRSKFRAKRGESPEFEKIWETLDLLHWAKLGDLTEEETERLCESIAKGYLPKEALKGIDFNTLLMTEPLEQWSDARLITAVLHLPYASKLQTPRCWATFERDLEDVGETHARIVNIIQGRVKLGEAQAQYIYGLILQKWHKSREKMDRGDWFNAEVKEWREKSPQYYFDLAAKQDHPLALYRLNLMKSGRKDIVKKMPPAPVKNTKKLKESSRETNVKPACIENYFLTIKRKWLNIAMVSHRMRAWNGVFLKFLMVQIKRVVTLRINRASLKKERKSFLILDKNLQNEAILWLFELFLPRTDCITKKLVHFHSKMRITFQITSSILSLVIRQGLKTKTTFLLLIGYTRIKTWVCMITKKL